MKKIYPNCFDFPNGPKLKTYFGNLAIQPSLYVSRGPGREGINHAPLST